MGVQKEKSPSRAAKKTPSKSRAEAHQSVRPKQHTSAASAGSHESAVRPKKPASADSGTRPGLKVPPKAAPKAVSAGKKAAANNSRQSKETKDAGSFVYYDDFTNTASPEDEQPVTEEAAADAGLPEEEFSYEEDAAQEEDPGDETDDVEEEAADDEEDEDEEEYEDEAEDEDDEDEDDEEADGDEDEDDDDEDYEDDAEDPQQDEDSDVVDDPDLAAVIAAKRAAIKKSQPPKPAESPKAERPSPARVPKAQSPHNTSGGQRGYNIPKIRKAKRLGINFSVFVLLLFFFLICFVLPRMSRFNHVVNVEAAGQSSGVTHFIRFADEGYDVARLQRALYKSGYIELDDINSRFDDVTLNALNRYLEEHNLPVGTDCSYESFQAVVLGLEGPVSGTDAAVSGTDQTSSTANSSLSTDTSSTETSASATQEFEGMRVRLTQIVDLHAEPDVNSTIYYTVRKNNKKYRLFDVYTDENGKTWYKIKYFVDLESWIEADKAELVP